MSNIETAIEEMIQSYTDEQDYVCRLDAEQYTDSELNDFRADMEGEHTELQHRIEALEGKEIPAELQEHIYELEHRIETLEGKTKPAAEEQEPRPVNQIDWIMTTHGLIAGYDSKATLEAYVRSVLPADQTHQAEMIIAMTLATARNIINKKLEAES